jgi:hypothetical protein
MISEEKIKRAFFYLDYLRLHNFGRKNKIFNKNRYMLNHLNSNDSKKGYKAYIQRVFRDLIGDSAYRAFGKGIMLIKKPRDVFGYNVDDTKVYESYGGPDQRYVPIFDGDPLEKARYAYKKTLLSGTFAEEFREMANIINNTSTLQQASGLAFKIRLDNKKSKGWETLKSVERIFEIMKDTGEKLEPETLIKSTIVELLSNVRKPVVGMQFYKMGTGGAQTNIVYTIDRVEPRHGNSGRVKYYEVYYQPRPGTRAQRTTSKNIQLLFNEEGQFETREMVITRELGSRAAILLRDSRGITEDAALRLARVSYARELMELGEDDDVVILNNTEINESLIDFVRGLL